MKKIVTRLVLNLALIVSFNVAAVSNSFAHGEESRVGIELDESAFAAGDVSLSFDLVDLQEKTTLTPSELNVVHERKLHLFIFDPALIEFRHVHPEFTNSKWTVTTDLQKNGHYWIWAQGEISKGKAEFSSNTRAKVSAGLAENPTLPNLPETRTGTDGISRVTLSKQKIQAGQMVMLDVDFSRTDGSKPEITPYLGAKAHVIGVLSDGDTLIHVHPMNTANPNTLMLHATFPEPGNYRLWVQFNDAGILKTVPLAVVVQPAH